MSSSAASERYAISLPTFSIALEVASNTSETDPMTTLGLEVVALGSPLLLLAVWASKTMLLLPLLLLTSEVTETEGFT